MLPAPGILRAEAPPLSARDRGPPSLLLRSPRGDLTAHFTCAALMSLGLGGFSGAHGESSCLLGSSMQPPHPPPQLPRGVNASFAPVLPGSQMRELQPCLTLVPCALLTHKPTGCSILPQERGGGGVPTKKCQSTCFETKVPGKIHGRQSWKTGYHFKLFLLKFFYYLREREGAGAWGEEQR